MSEEETVDWGDVEATSVNPAVSGSDDVISLGGAEELEEEVSPPKEEVVKASNGKADEKSAASIPAADVMQEALAKPLPPGWKLQHARSGGTYYFNTITGKTTWEFPAEDASTETATPAGEKLAGIQIKGAAKVAPTNEEEAALISKKRDAKEEEVVIEEVPQKRRRSNTPEKKRDTWSASPEPAPKRDDRARETKPREENQSAGGWGRRPEIASELNRTGGAQDARPRRYDNEPRESSHSSRQYPDDTAGRDRNYQRGQNGGIAAAAPAGRFVRPDNYQPDRSRPAYDDRRPSARDEVDRNSGRKREPSPPPRRREDYDRGSERDSRKEIRDRDREREPERRNTGRDQYREPERDRPRDYAAKDVRSDRGNEEDRRSVNRSETSRSSAAVAPYDRSQRSDRPAGYQNQGYGNQGYNYMDRGNGPRPPRAPYSATDSTASMQTGYGPQRGYVPRSFRPEGGAVGPASPVTPFSPGGYGPQRGMPPYPAGGAPRPVRPWIAPEEKAKKWWNKNSGEKKPVDPIAAAEAEENERRNRRSSSKPSFEQVPPPPVYKTDRERELAEREAAIARKERELGLK